MRGLFQRRAALAGLQQSTRGPGTGPREGKRVTRYRDRESKCNPVQDAPGAVERATTKRLIATLGMLRRRMPCQDSRHPVSP
jgi:hypothetical protein